MKIAHGNRDYYRMAKIISHSTQFRVSMQYVVILNAVKVNRNKKFLQYNLNR